MGDITANGKRRNSHRSDKKSTRIDLTPMVDLGFLLITFFVFTTTMSEAKIMNINFPKDKDSTTDPICESCALTLVAGNNNVLYYYEGAGENSDYKTTLYSAGGLRKIIMHKKSLLVSTFHKDRLVVIIKPGKQSNLKNLVDIIDECNICLVKKYYIAELTTKDSELIGER